MVWKAAASQGLQEIPLAGPMHSKATQVKNAVKVKGESVRGKPNSTYLHDEHLLPGIMNQEVERLAPER